MATRGLSDVFTLSPQAYACVHIGQTTHAHVINTKCKCLTLQIKGIHRDTYGTYYFLLPTRDTFYHWYRSECIPGNLSFELCKHFLFIKPMI